MNTATQKQIDFINKLQSERDPNSEQLIFILHLARESWKSGEFTAEKASKTIDALLSLPKKEAPTASNIEAGIYFDGVVYIRVYLGQQSGKMLAKELLLEEGTLEYRYLGLASKHVTEKFQRLSVEEVGQLGQATTHCLVCGRRLDDPESVDLGIGPVCAKNY